jgi:hypothetical protein
MFGIEIKSNSHLEINEFFDIKLLVNDSDYYNLIELNKCTRDHWKDFP